MYLCMYVYSTYECPYMCILIYILVYETSFPLWIGFDYMDSNINQFQNENVKNSDMYGEDEVRKPDR
jgi:hypothetical protein